MICHRIMPRVMELVLKPQSAASDDVGDEASSFQVHCSKKRRQACEFLGERPDSEMCVVQALLSTSPLDKLSARLQHLDVKGESMMEAVSTSGALHICHMDLCRLVQGGQESAVGDLFAGAVDCLVSAGASRSEAGGRKKDTDTSVIRNYG